MLNVDQKRLVTSGLNIQSHWLLRDKYIVRKITIFTALFLLLLKIIAALELGASTRLERERMRTELKGLQLSAFGFR